jgi:hypothetical protein
MFTQSCFIRKNSIKLQKKLKELGYKTDYQIVTRGCIATSSLNCTFSIITKEMFDSTNPNITWNNGYRIDCGYNDDLFLALAALRDDTDSHQWFVDDNTGIWERSENELPSRYMQMEGHKATVEEIIKHFT